MKATGRHLLVEYRNCDPDILNNPARVEELMQKAALAAEATIVASVFHQFSPQGVSGVVVIEESHLSIHTWPEHGYAAVDFFTCGECIPERSHDVLKNGLLADNSETMFVLRGLVSENPSMRVVEHRAEGCSDTSFENIDKGKSPSETCVTCRDEIVDCLQRH